MTPFYRTRTRWNRVSRANPCPICGRQDWCLITGPEHDPTAAICARIESDKRVGDKGAGWLHRLRDDDSDWRQATRFRRVAVAQQAPERATDFTAFATKCSSEIGAHVLSLLALELGVSTESLERLGVGACVMYGRRFYSFPMRSGDGAICGIRLRGIDGGKLSAKGSRSGLFIPRDLDTSAQLLVCEGPTDTAAMLDLGFSAIGRPNCSAGGAMLTSFIASVERPVPREIVIVADHDAPGQRGAWHLASTLIAYVPAVRVIVPPQGVKDAREWKRRGATRDDILAVIDEAPTLQISYSTKGGTQ